MVFVQETVFWNRTKKAITKYDGIWMFAYIVRVQLFCRDDDGCWIIQVKTARPWHTWTFSCCVQLSQHQNSEWPALLKVGKCGCARRSGGGYGITPSPKCSPQKFSTLFQHIWKLFMPAGASEDFFLFCAVEIDSLLLLLLLLYLCSCSCQYCYHTKQKHCIFFSPEAFCYTQKVLKRRFRPQTWLGELTTLPRPLVGWGEGQPLPNSHPPHPKSPPLDAFVVSIWTPDSGTSFRWTLRNCSLYTSLLSFCRMRRDYRDVRVRDISDMLCT